MDSLGEFFREAREAQNLTFEQVAASTRIQETYLHALEEERFHLLPEKVFTKGFVRTYARALGLDEEEALRRFAVSSGTYYQKEEDEQQQVLQREEEVRKGKANRNAVVILTGIILIGLIFILPREQSSPPSSTPPPTESPGMVSEPPIPSLDSETLDSEKDVSDGGMKEKDAAQQLQPQTPSREGTEESIQTPRASQPEPSTSTSPQRPSKPQEPTEPVDEAPEVISPEPVTRMETPFEPGRGQQDGPLMLELEALEITWVVVRSDDRPPHEALLQPGERALWRAHDRFLLTLGNAGGVKVTLNGEPQGPFGEAGAVVRDLEIKP